MKKSAHQAPGEPGRELLRTSELVRHVDDGDRRRLDELYDRVAPALFAWAAIHIPRSLAGRIEPDELLGEVWLRALQRFATFDRSTTPFRAWIFTIARHVLREGLRSTLRGPKPAPGAPARAWAELHDVPDSVTRISRAAARNEALARFVDDVRDYDDDERRLLIYRGLEGLPHATVARRLGISPDSTKKRWERLVAKMRDTTSIPPDLFAP